MPTPLAGSETAEVPEVPGPDWLVIVKLPSDGETEIITVDQLVDFRPHSKESYDPARKYIIRTNKWSGDPKTFIHYKVFIRRIAANMHELEESFRNDRLKFPQMQPSESDYVGSEAERQQTVQERMLPAALERQKRKALSDQMDDLFHFANNLEKPADGLSASAITKKAKCAAPVSSGSRITNTPKLVEVVTSRALLTSSQNRSSSNKSVQHSQASSSKSKSLPKNKENKSCHSKQPLSITNSSIKIPSMSSHSNVKSQICNVKDIPQMVKSVPKLSLSTSFNSEQDFGILSDSVKLDSHISEPLAANPVSEVGLTSGSISPYVFTFEVGEDGAVSRINIKQDKETKVERLLESLVNSVSDIRARLDHIESSLFSDIKSRLANLE